MAWKKIIRADHTVNELAAPTADFSMNSNKITDLADGVNAGDAVNRGQLDSLAAGVDWKESVRVATTAAGTLATDFENGDTIDGVMLATGDRILIKDQATGSENGIYTVNASGAPTRATDADADAEVTSGMAMFVEEGSTNGGTKWILTTTGTITVDTTSLTFSKFSALDDLTAGSGLAKTGDQLDADFASETEDTSPVGDDWVLVEDFGVAGQFRKVKLSNLPVAAHRLDEHDDPTAAVSFGASTAPQEAQHLRLHNSASAPSSGNEGVGQIYFNTTDDELYVWVA